MAFAKFVMPEDTEFKKEKSLIHLVSLFFLYAAAHIFLLLSKVVMWDGRLWTQLLKQKHYDIISQLLEQARLFHVLAVYRLLDLTGNPVFYSNALSFVSWFIAGVCVYFILRQFSMKARDAFFVTAIFLLIPIFIVRFQFALVTYSLSNMFFFLAVYIYLLSERTPKKMFALTGRFASFLFFSLSFLTNSFLVFYGGFVLFILARDAARQNIGFGFTAARLRLAGRWIFKHPLLVLLPIIFYLAERLFIGAPHGVYKEYNLFVFLYPGATIQKTVFLLADRAWQFIAYGFFWPILASISILQRKVFLVIFMSLSALLYFFLRKYVFRAQIAENASPIAEWGIYRRYFFAGCILFVLGFIPYILVGESPNPYGHGFDMRHGLLLPLGSALILLSLLRGCLPAKRQALAASVIFSLFITFNLFNYYSVDMDYYKQLGIIESLRSGFEKGEISRNSIVVFNDKLPMYNWRGRTVEDFEYTAYLYEASGSEEALGTVLGSNLSSVLKLKGRQDYPSDKMIKERLVYADIVSLPVKEPTFVNWLKLKKTGVFGGQTELADLIKAALAIDVVIPSRGQSWLEERR